MSDYIELDLTVRTFNALKRAGIDSELGSILNAMAHGIEHFMKIRNFKTEYMVEILNFLFEYVH